jgi:drug/metabolite transporter (DMT)-like permease
VGILHEHIGVETGVALLLILGGVFLITRPSGGRAARLVEETAPET